MQQSVRPRVRAYLFTIDVAAVAAAVVFCTDDDNYDVNVLLSNDAIRLSVCLMPQAQKRCILWLRLL